MRGVVTSRCPDQEDDSTLRHAEALQPHFTVALARVFHRDHREVKDGFQSSKIDLVLPEILPTLWLVPGDRAQTVYAFCNLAKQTVDAECGRADVAGVCDLDKVASPTEVASHPNAKRLAALLKLVIFKALPPRPSAKEPTTLQAAGIKRLGSGLEFCAAFQP